MKRALYRLYQKACALLMRQTASRACRRGRIDAQWRDILCAVAGDRPSRHTCEMLRGFLDERIVLRKRAASWEDLSTPTVVCVEKNSLPYMKKFLPYYRDLGVGHFIFIDNESRDGTAAFLEAQEDVTLYTAPYPFQHNRKAGWLLQAVREAGTARWYLRLDADEFLAWEGMEGSSLPELIGKMEKLGMGTCRALMADMYPAYALMDGRHDDDRFLEDCVYFDDASSYRWSRETDEIFGGMRKRTAGADLRMDKYVIFRPDRGYYPVTNHNMTGVRGEEERVCRGILRHYKFLPSQGEKYRALAADKRSGYAGLRQVGKYGKMADGSVNALSEHSLRYESSASIRELDFIVPL